MLPTITNTSISTKLYWNIYLFVSTATTKAPENKWGSDDCSEKYNNTVVN